MRVLRTAAVLGAGLLLVLCAGGVLDAAMPTGHAGGCPGTVAADDHGACRGATGPDMLSVVPLPVVPETVPPDQVAFSETLASSRIVAHRATVPLAPRSPPFPS
jgi:hypothetical protein